MGCTAVAIRHPIWDVSASGLNEVHETDGLSATLAGWDGTLTDFLPSKAKDEISVPIALGAFRDKGS